MPIETKNTLILTSDANSGDVEILVNAQKKLIITPLQEIKNHQFWLQLTQLEFDEIAAFYRTELTKL